MDIAGAKALKTRLRHQGGDDAPTGSAYVPEDAPPIYHYLGLSEPPLELATTAVDEAPAGPSRSRLRRLWRG